MEQRHIELVMGALLHDIGKVIQRANKQRIKHSAVGKEYIEKYVSNRTILDIIANHHAYELTHSKLASNHLAYIVYIADNIASGLDRRNKIEVDSSQANYLNFDAMTNQEDIFNYFLVNPDKGVGNRYYVPRMLDDREEIVMAQESDKSFSAGKYAGIVNRISEQLETLQVEQRHINSLLNLLEATLSYVPSSTNQDEVADISLFDHVKLTAAFSSAIYAYLVDKGETDYKQLLYTHSKQFYSEEAFLLVSFDISGIQDFIYTIRDAKAAKMLRSRSFYLEMLAEHYIDEMLSRLKLTRANVLYTGGGHAYLIVANTEQTKQILADVETEMNQFLREQFGALLYIASGFAPFAGEQLFVGNDASYQAIYKEVSQSISEKKIARYSADDIRQLNQQGKQVGRECPVCHRIHQDATEHCAFCEGLIQLSRPLQIDDFIRISTDTGGVPIGFGCYLDTVKDTAEARKISIGTLYAKNKFYFGDYQNVHLWMGDYHSGQTFNEFASDATGIERMAVLRCDVDNLGQAFIGGYSAPYATMSRTATFSRTMSLFFKYHINHLLQDMNADATIIYAGGDDVFVVGEWSDIIQFAIKLREEFIEFTQGKLTLSAGIGMFPAKTPVSIMAAQTGELESQAKEIDDDKDGIALFDKSNVFKWDHFIRNIWNDKYQLISNYMQYSGLETEMGKGFIYQLITLLRERLNTKDEYKTITWAHLAYYLSRMEPKQAEKRQIFRQFAEKLHGYFETKEDAAELVMALELYIYTIRGE
ncbi:type III-A CRISPR-associated protein Cas10/Csm1 [Tuanshanicoccus lijuaniae]|uniref:type III-A CRISPR-associated protein Cas10/Csm1 n=1 Tax=Aerococcaceae bacterium zg-1292 TaxID=2774330 RepID=UPI001BD83E7B|nr:type III-A CRISPR-associated protein Cas10/Csm1 [Aerococcaceae bacterium zg-A91]MBS4458505.1 type III-A CRISPR-associated protein Cas10/Csm1 [Aerococcaceae bacterium zg-BR33]